MGLEDVTRTPPLIEILHVCLVHAWLILLVHVLIILQHGHFYMTGDFIQLHRECIRTTVAENA